MLTDKYIRELIEDYSKTPEGKKQIKSLIPRRKFIAEYESDDESDRRRIEVMCKDMRNILYNHIKEVIPSFKISDIIIGKIKYEGVNATVDIKFNQDALKRKSLYEQKYPEGVHDIVRLFISGYSAGDNVYGVWHGKRIASLKDRAPNDFMQRAINEFNIKYGDCAVADLDEQYKTNG